MSASDIRAKWTHTQSKSMDQVPLLACALNGSYTTSHDIYAASHNIYAASHNIYAASHDIYAASHRFLIKLRHYNIDQLYLHKVTWYLIDWRLFVYVYNSFIYNIWGGFQNNTLKDILLLNIFCTQSLNFITKKNRFIQRY